MHTFDVVNAGPRSRFVILTNAGPVVVHNCMFGQGWKGLIDYATTYGVTLDEEESRSLVGVYRGQYPHVQKTWYACGDAMLNALRSPGVAFDVGRHIKFLFDGHWLNLRLPSGRVIAWYQPTIEPRETPWGAIRDAVVCWQTNPLTKKYERKVLIGSSAFQSAVQGSARDLLIHGVNNVDAAGYPVVLRVHDEVLSLVPEGFGDADEFGARLCAQPTWAADLPLAYEAWRGKRFRK